MVNARKATSQSRLVILETGDAMPASSSHKVAVAPRHGFVRIVANIALTVTVLCALVISAATVCILGIQEMDWATGFLCLLLNVAFWSASALLWNFLNPEPSTVETEIVATAPAATVAAPRHWWTDTALREENQQRLGR